MIITLSAISAISWAYTRSRRPSPVPLPPGPRGLPLVPFLDPELHTHLADPRSDHEALARQQARNHRELAFRRRGDTQGPRRHVREPGCAGFDVRRIRHRVDPVRGGVADAEKSVRAEDAREQNPGFGVRSPAEGGPEGGAAPPGAVRVVGKPRGADVLDDSERDYEHDVGRDGGGGGEGKPRGQAVAEMPATLGMPNVSDFYPSLARFDLQGIRRRTEEMARRFDRIFEEVVEQQLKMDGGDSPEKENDRGSADSQDFVQFLLKLRDEGADAKTPFTMTHLKALLMDMVVGGSYTTSNTLEFDMAEIMNKPEVMRKVQLELDTVVGRDTIVEESHIQKLPYLLTVLKENLRLHPALPLLVPHSPSKTCTIGQFIIPKGSRVFVNVWAIQRDSSIWENPLEFEAERFLINSSYDFSGNDFNYFPFGSGRRICAGIAMAERMSMFLLATILHSFNWALHDGEKLIFLRSLGLF